MKLLHINNLPPINLSTLHESMKRAFKQRFPQCRDVDYYNRPGEIIDTPAIYFGLIGFEPANYRDSGTGQLEIELKFCAHAIVCYKNQALLDVRCLALDVAQFVHGNRWGHSVSQGRVELGEEFSDAPNGYDIFAVSWSHTAFLGDNIWEEEGSVPKTVLASAVPQIGIPHEPKYVPVIEEKEAA